ncbi:MAG: hypothetical protein HC871_04970 [Rhizobiales bacterium]|nr:hypothetical protein [Hyphomicrobiales bacterium]
MSGIIAFTLLRAGDIPVTGLRLDPEDEGASDETHDDHNHGDDRKRQRYAQDIAHAMEGSTLSGFFLVEGGHGSVLLLA